MAIENTESGRVTIGGNASISSSSSTCIQNYDQGQVTICGNASISSSSSKCIEIFDQGQVTIGGSASVKGSGDILYNTELPAIAAYGGTLSLNDSAVVSDAGVGIVNEGGTVTMSGNSKVTGCSTGGITNISGTLIMRSSSSIEDATYYTRPAVTNSATLTIQDQASVRSNGGDGIQNNSGASLTITGSATVADNHRRGIQNDGALEISGQVRVAGRDDGSAGAGGITTSGSATIKGNAKVYGFNWPYSDDSYDRGSQGGGVLVDGGTLDVLESAEVSGNTATRGGGICVKRGTLHLSGNAKVTGNAARSYDSWGSMNLGEGGGIYVAYGMASLIMDGSAFVSGNEADGDGAGIRSLSPVTLAGSASITDNTSQDGCGGILLESIESGGSAPTINLSGDVDVSNNRSGNTQSNVVVAAGSEVEDPSIVIVGRLNASRRIGVSRWRYVGTYPEREPASGPVTSSGFATHYGGSSDQLFRCEAPGYCLALSPDGEVQQVPEEAGRPTTYTHEGQTYEFTQPLSTAEQLLSVTGDAMVTTPSNGYFLVEDIRLPSSWRVAGSGPSCEFDLNLNGHTITAPESGSAALVDDCTLRVFDSRGTGSVTGGRGSGVLGSSRGSGGGFAVGGAAFSRDLADEHLLLYGVEVSGNEAERSGGGVSVRSSSVAGPSSVTLLDDSSVRRNQAVSGGGIAADDASLVRLGGAAAVSGNVADASGGGVRAGQVELEGSASVSSNEANGEGGGVWSRSLSMADDASVRGNQAASSGGGMRVEHASMSGASSVRDNTAGSYAGGVAISRSLSMTDRSSVSGNSADVGAGGVLGLVASSDASPWPAATVGVSGEADISGNACGTAGSNLVLAASYDGAPRLARLRLDRAGDVGGTMGVSACDAPASLSSTEPLSPHPAALTEGYALEGAADRYLRSELDGYGLEFDGAGEVALVPHTHRWAYEASGDRVLAWCSTTSTTCEHAGRENACTLRVSAEDMGWDSRPYDRVRIENGITPVTGEPAGAVEYYRAASAKDSQVAGKQRLAAPPSDAGDYIAAVRVGGVVAAAHFTILPEPVQAMHRLYNPNSGEHFYTANAGERDACVRAGWRYEGIGWTAPKSGPNVYRLYNANAGDHHYTLSANERDTLKRVGWKDEGVAWHSDARKRVPLYRQYNPNAVAGSHNYTKDPHERDSLVRIGWRDEGIGWYGVR